MTQLTESTHAFEFLASEANGARSREQGILASGNNLSAGAVLGVITASGKYAEYNPGNADGSETAVAVLADAVDASAADADCVVVARDAEVKSGSLAWFSGATAGQKTTGESDLAAVGIIAR